MTFHFPDDVATNLLTIDAHGSEVGDGGVQGGGGRSRVCDELRTRKATSGTANAVEVRIGFTHRRRRADERGARRRSMRCWGRRESGWAGGAQRHRHATSAHRRGGLAEVEDRRDLLLPALHAVQDRVGWISRGALNYICQRLIVPPAEAWGVVTFYHLFKTEPQPPHRGARLRRHRLPAAGRRADLRGTLDERRASAGRSAASAARADSMHRGAGTALPAWANAIARRRR